MPLEDILRKIEEGASEESQRILAEVEEKSRMALDDARREASSRKEQIVGEARAQARRAESLSKARADAATRQTILRQKQAAVDAVFASALSSLNALPDDEYADILLRALSARAGGNEILILGPEDEERLGTAFIVRANQALASSGKAGRLAVEYAKESLGGGFALSSGGVTENLTFPTLVKRFRDDMEIDVARILFEES